MKKLIAFMLILTALSLCSCSESDFSVSVDVLDIGKADCVVVTTGTKTVMIDTGEQDDVSDIIAFLETKRIKEIDALIISHFDKDHIGGAAELISKYGITNVYETGFTSNRGEYDLYHEALENNGAEPTVLKQDFSFTFDECAFTIYAPKAEAYSVKQDNNASLIVSMEYGEKRFLFCGDAMELRLDEFLADSPGKFDYVKLPYHGNYLKNYPEFLEEISPEYGVITCSNKNPAADETLNILSSHGVKVYQTENGSVSMETDGQKIRVSW